MSLINDFCLHYGINFYCKCFYLIQIKKRNRKFPVCRAILNFLSDYNEQDVTLRATKDVVSLFTDIRYLHVPVPNGGDICKSLDLSL